MINSLYIIGRMGGDVEDRETSTGRRLKTFSVAYNARKGSKTIWVKCIIWENNFSRFDKMLSFLSKGSPVCVCGELSRVNSYKNKYDDMVASAEISVNQLSFVTGAKRDELADEQSGSSFNMEAINSV